MAYVNKHTSALSTPHLQQEELYGPSPYDINWAYPIHEATLESDRLKLVPFVPAEHAQSYWANVGDHTQSLFRYYPFMLSTLEENLTYFELTIRRDPQVLLLAAFDKTRPDPEHPTWAGSLAGVIMLLGATPTHATTELAFVLVFPAFQRTHVSRNMVGLALRYALQLPTAALPGMGLRRVQWTAHPDNFRSWRLAERMGMKREGLMRWVRVLPRVMKEVGKEGRESDAAGANPSRDSIMLSVCWDDWEGGVRDHVQALIDS